ncbi:unnamed protein product [Lactuca saligna]|uniref:Uncharacterized protein n=1 Tax=Lactuca saligna TaxID=75948 RepID=A0AA36EJD0_LACSI|nr:unnamed protein product [Lactuca saligna]
MMDVEENEYIEFAELEFDSKEDVEDHAIISGKQYKILNSKLNTIIQFLNDSSAFTLSYMSKEDVYFLLKGFHDRLSKFDIPSTTSPSQEQMSYVVSLVESCFKTQLAPILDLVLQLPTNFPPL